ncbi:hypothetical protein Emed_002626 [Eimeria media]
MSRQTESKPQVQLICERLIDSFAARLQQDKSVALPKDVQEDFLRIWREGTARRLRTQSFASPQTGRSVLSSLELGGSAGEESSKSKRRRVAEIQSDDEFEDANVDSLKASNETDDLGLLLSAEEKSFMEESGLGAPPPLADLTETSGAPQPTDKIIGRFDKISRPGEISRGLLTQERTSAWSFVLSPGLMKSNNHLLAHADAAAATAASAEEATTAAAVTAAATAAAEGSSEDAAVMHACAAGGKASFDGEFKAAVYDEVVFMNEALKEARRAAAEGEVPVGCVLVCPSSLQVVGRGGNKTNLKKNATRHCELEAVDDFLTKYTKNKLQQQQQHQQQQQQQQHQQEEQQKEEEQQQQQESSANTPAAAAAVAAEAREALASLHLYVTCEPCIMCAWALRLCRIQRVFFGCSNSRFGGCGTVLNVHAAPTAAAAAAPAAAPAAAAAAAAAAAPPPLECKGGICAEEAVELLRVFYSRGNPHAPAVKRKRPLFGADERETVE